MKNYTDKQIETALKNKGFYCTGGVDGLVEIERPVSEGGNYWEDGTISSHYTFMHSNGHTSLHAVVEGGHINGIHPVAWFNSIKDDLK